MASNVRYRLTKELFIYSNNSAYMEAETLGAIGKTTYGGVAFLPPQSMCKYRDYKNINNDFAQIAQTISNQTPKIGIKKSMNVAEVLELIDKQIGGRDAKFDAKVLAYTESYHYYEQGLRDIENYIRILAALQKFSPIGIKAMVTGAKYPLKAATQDFLKFVDRKQTLQAIEALPKNLAKRLGKFCAENNFVLTEDAAREEIKKLNAENRQERYPSWPDTPEDVKTAIGSAANDMLRDAAKYEYFRLTGNMDVFMSTAKQHALKSMPDNDLAKNHAPYAMQYWEDALIIKQRMESIMITGEDITPFMKSILKHARFDYAYYCNPDIVRMMYDTLKIKYNRFNINPEVNEFMRSLLGATSDKRLIEQMCDTFALDYDAEYKKTKQNKMRSKVALTVAAQRIKDGKPMSNVAVLNAVGEMRQQFAVETTDQTFDRVKDTKKPTKAQLAIVKKFGEHRM
ncbi:MAG: hypothetical protein IKK76_04485 [Alphaproteobacteria bacterium]|nr:hypothetical protein [Alphaproteobacteria bacterium]